MLVPQAVAVDEGDKRCHQNTRLRIRFRRRPQHRSLPSTPEDMRQVTSTESVRQTDRAKVFVVEAAEGSPSTVMCQDDQDIGPDLTREGHHWS